MLLHLLYLTCASFGWPVNSLSDHCGDHCASIQRLWQPFSSHDNGSVSTPLPPMSDLLYLCSSFGNSSKAQESCCSRYTETVLFRFRWPSEHPDNFAEHSKVAGRSQSCVKGMLHINFISIKVCDFLILLYITVCTYISMHINTHNTFVSFNFDNCYVLQQSAL